MKWFVFNLIFVLISQTAYTQQTVRFERGTDLCEHVDWKLVWYDEFDGDRLDDRKWYTFIDDDNWVNSQVVDTPIAPAAKIGKKVIYSEANITVENGACRLHIKYGPYSFMGIQRNFTSGMLMAKNKYSTGPLYFNKGKFEVRAKLPVSAGVWATFWLFGGGPPDINKTEIDMFEYNPCASGLDELPYHIHGNHREPEHKNHFEVTGRTKSNNLGDWHIYTTEWDKNFIRLYMDGELRGMVSRYNSDCLPNNGEQYVEDPGNVFPRPDEFMKLLLTLDYTDDLYTKSILGICTPIPGWIANRQKWDARQPERIFEIDYVRVYQRVGEVQENLR